MISKYYFKEMHQLILDQGQLVYNIPTLEEVKLYAQKDFESIWSEVTRLLNPSIYYVDLSQGLYDLKQGLIQAAISKK